MNRKIKKRKIIQITTMVLMNDQQKLVALADDGTMWWCDFEIQRWFQVATDVEDEGGSPELIENTEDDLL